MQGSNNWSYRVFGGGSGEKDPNLIPENIKKGVTIDGVVGTAKTTNAKITNVIDLFENNYRNDCIQDLLELCDNITDMNNMFYKSNALTSLDLSNFDTSEVTNMSSMFYECEKLTSLDLSNFDTSKVTNMSSMFYKCLILSSLDLSNFDTSEVTNMSKMFFDCRNLSSLDLSNFDTSKVTDMSYMFYDGYALTSLDLSNFDTSKVTNMSSMFDSCKNLTILDLSNFDTSEVTDMSSMFYNCSKIKSLNISNFDTSKVTSAYNMFYGLGGTYGFTDLDLSNFDFSSVIQANNIVGCNPNSGLVNFTSFRNLGKGYTQKSNNYSKYKVSFDKCTKLTTDSLMSIINNLYDLNLTYDVANGGTLASQSLVLGSTNLAKLTADEIAIATNKGWNVS